MKLKEKISIQTFNDKKFKIRVVESAKHQEAAFTHYLHNHLNSESKYFKKDAVRFVKKLIEYKFPKEQIDNIAAEKALQQLLFDLDPVPFPSPQKPTFKFIDLFAGIGGFRVAMQNLGGKCLFSSEWDKYAQQTYKANFGETPFGDITQKRPILHTSLITLFALKRFPIHYLMQIAS